MMRKEKMFGSGMFVFCSFYDNLDGSVFRLVFFFFLFVCGGWLEGLLEGLAGKKLDGLC